MKVRKIKKNHYKKIERNKQIYDKKMLQLIEQYKKGFIEVKPYVNSVLSYKVI